MALRRISGRLLSNLGSLVLPPFPSRIGFKEVREEDKSKLVGNVFRNVASNYDLMNDIMSVGLHRLWKDKLVSKLHPFLGMKHLDVAGGTGDIAFRVLESINSVIRRATQDGLAEIEETQIHICDINPDMLNVGKKRAIERGLGEDRNLCWVKGDAEALSFEDGSMDGYTIAFGIRNVTHVEQALKEAYSYDYYSFSIIPSIGELVASDRDSYQYLVESIHQFPKQEKLAGMIADVGFQKVEYENMVGGVVAFHSALKL